MVACRRDVSEDSGTVKSDFSERKEVNLDPAQVAVRPIPNTTMFSRVYDVGPEIMSVLWSSNAQALPDELRELVSATEDLVFLESYYFDSADLSPYPRYLVYDTSQSLLIAHGNVHFLEAIDLHLKSYSRGDFGANVHVRAELYRKPEAGVSEHGWKLADLEGEVPHQSFDLSSVIGETTKVEWSDGFSNSLKVTTERAEDNRADFFTEIKLRIAQEKKNTAWSYDGKIGLMNGEAMLVDCNNGNLMKLTTTLKLTDFTEARVARRLDRQKVDYIALQPLPGSPLILHSFLIDQVIMGKLFDDSEVEREPFSDVSLPPYEELDIHRVFPPELGDYFEATDVVRDLRRFMRKKGVRVPSDGYVLYNETKSHVHVYGTENGADEFRELVKGFKGTTREVLVELNTDAVKDLVATKKNTGPSILRSYRVPPDLLNLISDSPNYSDLSGDPFGDDDHEFESLTSLADHLTERLGEFPRVILPEIEGITDADDYCYDIRHSLVLQEIPFLDSDWAVFNASRNTVVAYTSSQSQLYFEGLFSGGSRRPMMVSFQVIEVSLPFEGGFSPSKPVEIYTHVGAKVESSGALITRSGEQGKLSMPKVENADLLDISLTVEPIISEYRDLLEVYFLYQRAKTKVSSSLMIRNGQTQLIKLFSDPRSTPKRVHYLLIQPKIIEL